MLKEFWEAKKHLIQLIGILSGVGALFLSIALPENIEARQALINIQFIWLIIITICLIVLFVNFMRLADFWEKSLKEKNNIDYTETISLLIATTLLYLIINLWMYMINLYKESLWNYLTMAQGAFISLGGAFIAQLQLKIKSKIPEEPKWKRKFFSLFSRLFFSVYAGFFLHFIFQKDKFYFTTALVMSGLIYIVTLLFTYQRSLKK